MTINGIQTKKSKNATPKNKNVNKKSLSDLVIEL